MTGSTRSSSSSAEHRLGARAGRLAADVDDRGALGRQPAALRERGLGVEVAAAVGERVGRDVEDADERAPRIALGRAAPLRGRGYAPPG